MLFDLKIRIYWMHQKSSTISSKIDLWIAFHISLAALVFSLLCFFKSKLSKVWLMISGFFYFHLLRFGGTHFDFYIIFFWVSPKIPSQDHPKKNKSKNIDSEFMKQSNFQLWKFVREINFTKNFVKFSWKKWNLLICF